MRKGIVILLAAMLLCGCTRLDEQVEGSPRVVTAIDASFDSGGLRLHRHYTDGDKMKAVLTFFRCLDIYAPLPEGPAAPGSSTTVTIHYSDGTQKVYELLGDQYLRQDRGSWNNINPEQAQELPLLLGLMESDEIS